MTHVHTNTTQSHMHASGLTIESAHHVHWKMLCCGLEITWRSRATLHVCKLQCNYRCKQMFIVIVVTVEASNQRSQHGGRQRGENSEHHQETGQESPGKGEREKLIWYPKTLVCAVYKHDMCKLQARWSGMDYKILFCVVIWVTTIQFLICSAAVCGN